MFDLGVRVRDARASARFFTAALAPPGLGPDVSETGFGPRGTPALWLHAAGGGDGAAHVSFVAPDRAALDRLRAAGVLAGGLDNGKPGLHPDHRPTYDAAFLLDPDGNNVEVVCLR